MPIIQFNYDSLLLNYRDVCHTMLFPNSRHLRDSYNTVEMMDVALGETLEMGEDNIEISTSMLHRLLVSPSQKEMTKLHYKAIEKGMIAGHILFFVFIMDLDKSYEASLRKAIYLCTKHTIFKGVKLTTEPTIRKYWDEYKSVAHFWCAISFMRTKYGITLHAIDSEKDAIIFFTIADSLRKFGENFSSQRNKNSPPLLDKNKLWNIPDYFEFSDMKISASEVPSHFRKILDQYSKRYTY